MESTDIDTRCWLSNAFNVDVLEKTALDPSMSTPPPDPYYETPVGILAKNENLVSPKRPSGSEVLIYGCRSTFHFHERRVESPRPAQDSINLPSYINSDLGPMTLYALFLSSNDPGLSSYTKASILISTTPHNIEFLPPPSNKRDRLTQLFDEAADARKRPRLSTDGRERSMSRASSIMTSPMLPQDGFAIETLSAPKQSLWEVVTESNGAQRVSGSTLAEGRPSSRARTLERTGTLLSQSFTADTMLEQQITNRNKEIINRAVLAGMKKYGLKTYKAGTKGTSSDSQAPETVETPNESAQVVEVDPRDVEYKSVYHQTNKSVVFAFRKSIGSTMLRQEAIKEAVDALLAVFCVEPG